jgi:hypothetical protein
VGNNWIDRGASVSPSQRYEIYDGFARVHVQKAKNSGLAVKTKNPGARQALNGKSNR